MAEEKTKEKLFLSLNIFLQFLGHSMYGVFIPIFLLKAGFSIQEIFVYGISDGLGTIVGALLAPFVISRLGLRFPLLFRALFQPVWLLALVNNSSLPFPIHAYGFVFGMFTCAYWISVTTYTVNSTRRGDRGSFSGITSAMVWISSIVAPLMGAFVIKSVGYGALFGTAMAVLALAIVPALLLPKISYSWGRGAKELSDEKKEFLGAMLLLYVIVGGAGIALYYAWPLFLYEGLGGEMQVGLVASLGSFFGLAGSLFGGWLADKLSKTRLIAASGSVLSLGWFASAFAKTPLALAAIVSMRRFSDEVTASSLFAKFSNAFSEDNLILRMGQRQLAIGAGLVLFGILATFLPIETFFVFVGMFFLLYAAAITELRYETERKLRLPKAAILLVEKAFSLK